MRKHISSWLEFANADLGIGLEESEILFVSGFTKTPVWATAAFADSAKKSELVVSGGSFVSPASGEFSVSMIKCVNPSVSYRAGPVDRVSCQQDMDTGPEDYDQCIFLNYYKMKIRVLRSPAILKAAAGFQNLGSSGDPNSEKKIAVLAHHDTLSHTDDDIVEPTALEGVRNVSP